MTKFIGRQIGFKKNGPRYFYWNGIPGLGLFIVVSAVILKFIFSLDYILSDLLLFDDTIYIGSYYLSEPVGVPQTQSAYYGVLGTLAQHLGLGAAKFVLAINHIFIGACAYLIIYKIAQNECWSALIAIALVSYPVAPDQYYFMTGAHPSAATALALALATLFFYNADRIFARLHRDQVIIWVAITGGTLLIVHTSPSFMLFPLITFVAIGVAVFVKIRNKIISRFDFLLFVPILLSIIGWAIFRGGYHYSGISGWVEFSLSQVIENLISALGAIVRPSYSSGNAITFIYGATFLFLVSIALFRATKFRDLGIIFDQRCVAMASVLLIAAGLTFGTTSTVTSYILRYAFGPYIFGTLFVFIILLTCFRSISDSGRLVSRGVTAALGVLCATSVYQSIAVMRSYLEPALTTHSEILDAVQSLGSFNEPVQVVVILPSGAASFTFGYNHWSTWYLRTITGNEAVIGLVGVEGRDFNAREQSVLVETYSDHDPAYWEVRNGRSTRLKMIGLEADRPTYVFGPGPDNDGLSLQPVMISDSTEILRFVEPGGRIDIAPALGAEDTADISICEVGPYLEARTLGPDQGLMSRLHASVLRSAAGPAEWTEQFGLSRDFDGESSTLQSIGALDSIVRISLRLQDGYSSLPAPKFDQATPPMALLSPSLALYRLNDGHSVYLNRELIGVFETNGQNNEFTLDVFICSRNSNALLIVNGIPTLIAGGFQVAGDWTFGRGFNQRYFEGTIDFNLSSAPE